MEQFVSLVRFVSFLSLPPVTKSKQDLKSKKIRFRRHKFVAVPVE